MNDYLTDNEFGDKVCDRIPLIGPYGKKVTNPYTHAVYRELSRKMDEVLGLDIGVADEVTIVVKMDVAGPFFKAGAELQVRKANNE